MKKTCTLFANCRKPATHHVFQRWNGLERLCCDDHIPGSRLARLPADHPVRLQAERLQAYTVTPLEP